MLPFLFGTLSKWFTKNNLRQDAKQLDLGRKIKRRTTKLECETLEYRVVPAANFSQFVDPHPAAGNQFGSQVVPLSTGNVVITSPYDDAGGTDAGAVYLFNGATGALISTLTGSHANDQVGIGGVTVLSNGNYVVRSSNWDNGAATDAGAVTWGSGTTGVSGILDSTNSVVGSSANDQVGSYVYPLNNGNYLVISLNWNGSRGAVTWGSGTSGVTGVVDSTNSLVGSSANDKVASYGITQLNNGNFVILSPNWNGVRGAATWVSGTNGVTGVIDSTNSLVGSSTGDSVGTRLYPLSNGNYVVGSSSWNGGRGAATWGSGTSGVSGVVDSTNSLVGNTANDQVGYYGITQLNNANYVVGTPFWNGNRGAATWCSGASGVTGVIDSTNSLVGSSAGDYVGYFNYPLTNGNYVVVSSSWNGYRGAVTWGDGNSGITGVVGTTNSLVGGSASDNVGASVVPLTNGNYVVSSYHWNGNRGAVTWVSGASGVSGLVSSTNSLVGGSANDYVGSHGVNPLSNGNYVVRSSYWNGSRGAVTWGSGTSGVTGVVNSTNSLVGSLINDQVGGYYVSLLSNGNYMVSSPSWNGSRGAVTWGSGTSGVTGVVNSTNSLVGSLVNDNVGGGSIRSLSNGNVVVLSPNWNGVRGAATWGSGTSGVTGVVDSTNSLVGSSANDSVANRLYTLSNGNYVVGSSSWNGNRGAVTWGNGSSGITGVVDSTNSLVGSSVNDQVGSGGIYPLSNGNYVLSSPNWDDGVLTNAGAITFGYGTIGLTGLISAANSLIGGSANSGLSNISVDNVNNTFYANFITEDNGKVRVGSQLDGFTPPVQASLDVSGNLVISDPADTNNGYHLSVNGTNLVVVSNGQTISNTGNISGATLSNGNTTLTIPLASITGTKIIVNGGGGDDTLTVDFSGGVLTKLIDFDGGANATSTGDKLVVTGGTFSTATHTFLDGSSGTLSFTGAGLISYTGLEPVDMSGTTVNDLVLNLPAGGSDAYLEDDGTAANGISQLRSNNGSFELTTFSNPTNSLTINRGNTVDTLTVSSLPDFTKALTVGSQTNPLATVTLAGTVNLDADKNLTLDAGTISFTTTSSDVLLLGSGSATLRAQNYIDFAIGSSLKTTDGSLTMEGNVAAAYTGAHAGIRIEGAQITTGTGLLTMTGHGGSGGTDTNGINVFNGAVVSSQSGDIHVIGTGGTGATTGTSNFRINFGVLVDTSGLIGGNGAVSVEGHGGTSVSNSDNWGIGVLSGGSIYSNNNNVDILAYGGGGGSSFFNHGIDVATTGRLDVGGTGTLTVRGYAGNSGTGGANFGVVVDGINSRIECQSGEVDVKGYGGGSGATSSNNYGVFIVNGGTVLSTGTGTVDVLGVGGFTGGSNNHGVHIEAGGSSILTYGGTVFVTGEGGTGSGNIGVSLPIGGFINTNSANPSVITITTDSLSYSNDSAISAGTGTVTIRNRTTGTRIELGGSDVLSGNPLTLGLSAGELNHITAGTLIIGRNDAFASGTITFSAPTTISASTPTLSLLTGASITGSGTISVNNLAMRAVTGITLTGVNNVDYLAAINTGSGGISYTDLNGFKINTVDGLTGITATGQDIQLVGGVGGSVDVESPISATGATGSISITTERNINVLADITAGNGISLVANTAGGVAGNFIGIDIVGATVNSGAGPMVINGTGGLSTYEFNSGVHVENHAVVTSTGGNVSITGIGGGNASSGQNYGVFIYDHALVTAGGMGTVTVTGTGGTGGYGAYNRGVIVITDSAITSSGGNVSVTGTGGGTGSSVSNFGVIVYYSSSISAGGSGTVTVTGYGGTNATGDNNWGVSVSGTDCAITSSGGNVSVTGTGGGTGSSAHNFGVYLYVSGVITAGGMGNVTVVGNGGTGSTGWYQDGVFLSGTGSTITSSGGNVSVTGTGGGSGGSIDNFGVELSEGGVITAGGMGTVSVVGYGSTTVSNSYANIGVSVHNAPNSMITSSGGNVSVTGTGGGSGSSSYGYGVQVADSCTITAGGSGTVTVHGQGSLTGTGLYQIGVILEANGTITSNNANVSVTGTGGGTGGSGSDFGIFVAGGSTITAGGSSSTVTVTGTGSADGTGDNQFGVYVYLANSKITSSGGHIVVNGTGGGSGGSTSSNAVYVTQGGQIKGTGSANVTVTGQGGLNAGGNSNFGVVVAYTPSQITSENGNVTVTGTGGGTGASSTNLGIHVVFGAGISTTGTGNVHVEGHGGTTSTGDYNAGIGMGSVGTLITSNGGSVTLIGTGGGTGNSGHNVGVSLDLSSHVSVGGNGLLTITGQGGAGGAGNYNHGIQVIDHSHITSNNNNIVMTATGGGGVGSAINYGVLLENNSSINVGGTGTLTLTGTGGSDADSNNIGVRLYINSQLTTNDGDITIIATGGGAADGSSSNHGVYLENNTTISAGGTGDVTITATAGETAGVGNFGLYATTNSHIITNDGSIHVTGTGKGHGTSSDDYGIWLQFDSTIAAGGDGDVTVHGESTSTGTGNYNYGLILENAGTGIFSNNGNVSVTGIAGGTGSGNNYIGVTVSAASQIHAGGVGTVTVTGTGGTASEGVNNYGVILVNSGVISSHDGNVTVTGTGGGTGSSSSNIGAAVENSSQISAGGSGTVNVTGTAGLDGVGVFVFSSCLITSNSGSVTITGTAGAGTHNDNYGVNISSASTVTAGGTATVTVTGTGGASTGYANIGVYVVADAVVTSSGGNVVVTGTGGGVGAASTDNYGVHVANGGVITAGGTGNVTVTGTGGDSTGGANHGVNVKNANAKITSSGGAVLVTGYGGGVGNASNDNYGVAVLDGGQITAGGTVTVNGFGGDTSAGPSMSIVAGGGAATGGKGDGGAPVLQEDAGATGLGDVASAGTETPPEDDGTGYHQLDMTPTHDRNYGVFVSGTNAVITSGGGAVTVNGTGGGYDNSDENNGVAVFSAGQITAGGAATVTVVGQAGPASEGVNNYGVYVRNTGSNITSSGGDVSVNGTGGGTDTGTFNLGVIVQGLGYISAGGSGNVTVLGIGGGGDGPDNIGVFLQDCNSGIFSNGGTISVTGVGGTGTGAEDYGVYFLGISGIASGGNAAVIVTTDSIYMNAGDYITAGSGILTIQNRTAGTQIDLGGADVLTGSPLTLGLSQAELNGMTAGILRVGRNDGTASGAITFSTAVTIPASVPTLSLRTVASIGGSGTVSVNNLAMQAVSGISLSGNNNVDTLAAVNSTSGGMTFNDINGFDVTAVDGVTGITANGQAVALTGGSGSFVHVLSPISATGTGGSVSIITPWFMTVQANITSGTGGVTLQANSAGSAPGSGFSNFGLWINGATVSSTTGPIALVGRGGASTDNYNHGVVINNNGQVITTGGNISITGYGAGTGSGSSHSHGVYLDVGAITAGGAGTITILGYGATSEGGVNGGVIHGSDATISSNTGSITITGFGGPTGTGNLGVEAGNIASAGGIITITGSAGSGSSNVGIVVDGLVQSTTGPVTLIGDSMDIRSTGNFSAAGTTVTLRPQTAGTAIDVGSTGGTTNGLLELSDDELDRITAATVILGDNTSGPITVSSAITHSNNLTLITVGTVTVNQPLTLATNKALSITGSSITTSAAVTTDHGNVSLTAKNGITLSAPLSTGGGHLAMSADSDADGTGTVTLANSVMTNWQQQAKVSGLGAANYEEFGFNIAMSTDGTTAIIGAYNELSAHGAAYIYSLTNGAWVQQARLILPGTNQDGFGFSVGLSADGNTAVIGAYNYTVPGHGRGTAFVFLRSGTSWSQTTELYASDGSNSDIFARSIAISDDSKTIAIGSPYNHIGQGVVYVFTSPSGHWSDWTEQSRLMADNGNTNQFAEYKALAISGDGNTIVVGDYTQSSNKGAAYVFTRSSGIWSTPVKLTASDGASNDIFGWSVAISSDAGTILVGAYNNNNGRGAAYLYTEAAGAWVEKTKLTASRTTGISTYFGWSVALSADGTWAVVGSVIDSVSGHSNQGSAYVYRNTAGTWTQQSEISASDGSTGDEFGFSVALSGDGNTLLVAALRDVVNVTQGSAYFYQNITASGGSINTGSGNATIKGADADFQAAITSAGTVTIVSEQAGRLIDIGTNTLGALSLTASELALISATNLIIGNTTSGAITISADVAVNNINTQLTSHNNIVFAGGQFNTGTGTLQVVASSAGRVKVPHAGVDATTSQLSMPSAILEIGINGNTVDTQYDQLKVNGNVNLLGTILSLAGSYSFTNTDSIVIVSASSITNTFMFYPNGTLINFNGQVLVIEYTATEVKLSLAGTLNVALDGSGNLVVTDYVGVHNHLTAMMSGTNLVISDTTEKFIGTAGIAGATLSADRKTLTVPISSITGTQVKVNTNAGDDTLTVDYTGGNFSKQIVYDGGTSGNDGLIIKGNNTQAVTFTTSITPGMGTIASTAGNVSFSEAGPVDFNNLGTLALHLPGSGDFINVANAFDYWNGHATSALQVAGSSGGTGFTPFAVWNVANLVLDTVTGGSDGNDTVIFASASVGNIGNLTVSTGTGNDIITVNGTVTVSGLTTLNADIINLSANVTNAVTGSTATMVNVYATGGQIQDGINVTASGATIYVAAGVYAEALTIPASRPGLQIRAFGPTGLRIISGQAGVPTITIAGANTTIAGNSASDNFLINQGSATSASGIVTVAGSQGTSLSYLSVQGGYIASNFIGIDIAGGTWATLAHVGALGYKTGVRVQNGTGSLAHPVVIQNSPGISSGWFSAIGVDIGTGFVQLTGNTITGNRRGVRVQGGTAMLQGNNLSNNNSAGASSAGLLISGGAVVDAGQVSDGTQSNYTGLGISTGGNLFTTGYATGGAQAIVNLNELYDVPPATAGNMTDGTNVSARNNNFGTSIYGNIEAIVNHSIDNNFQGYVDYRDAVGAVAPTQEGVTQYYALAPVTGTLANQRSIIRGLQFVINSPVMLQSGAVGLNRSDSSDPEYDPDNQAFYESVYGSLLPTGAVPLTMTSSVNGSTGRTTVNVTFQDSSFTTFGSLVDGFYERTVNASLVDLLFTNSGVHYDNTPITEAQTKFHRLYGDINGDQFVNVFDNARFQNAYRVSDSPYRPFFDYNNSGVVFNDLVDFTEFSKRFGGFIF